MINHIGCVSPYDEADTLIVQHDFMHLSFFADYFREFVDTLLLALREMEKAESPIKHIHPVIVRESARPDVSHNQVSEVEIEPEGDNITMLRV